MVEHSRYQVSESTAGLEGRILKNKLGIESQEKLDEAEAILLRDAYSYFFDLLHADKIEFDINLLLSVHKYFLGTLYSWAGTLRTVDMSKNGIMFASVKYLNKSLEQADRLLFKKSWRLSTPKLFSKYLAIVHNELNAIHPFRDGNGRSIRLFLDLIAGRQGFDPIGWNDTPRDMYLNACVHGMNSDHTPMAKVILAGLKKIA